MAGIATICWDFVPGSLSTKVEYRLSGDTDWIIPTSPNNPTLTNCYPLTIADNTFYDVRLTTNGISCGPKSTTLQIYRAAGSCCPPGYTLSEDGTFCFQVNTTAATPPSSPENTVAKSSIAYGSYGTLIYDPGYNINGTGTFTQISYGNTFWANGPGYPTFPGPGTVDGPLNRCGIWAATEDDNQTVGFTVCITTPTTGIYYVGIAGDNIPEIVLDGTTIIDMDSSAMSTFLAANGYPNIAVSPTESTFRFWHVYPVNISAGTHVLEMKCLNTFSIAAMGAEIYNLTSAQIQSATSYASMGSGLVFSTKDYVGQPVQVGTGGVGYTCPAGYSLILCDGPAYCTQTITTPIIECGQYCCDPGFTLSEDGTYCYQTNTTSATPPVSSENAVAKQHVFYSMCGSWLFTSFNLDGTGAASQITLSNSFWRNGVGNCTAGSTSDGPMNRCALWSVTEAPSQQIGFTVCINVPATKSYYMAVGSDNWSTIRVDGNTIVDQDEAAITAFFGPNHSPLSMWSIYPIQLTAGTHVVELIGNNGPGGGMNPGAMGAEIYDNTAAEIVAATSYGDLNLIFSTKDYVGQPIQIGTGGIGYTCPEGYSLVLCDGPAYCTQTILEVPELCISTTTTTTTSSTTTTTTTL